MELRHLKYFIAVAEELHFGRAAERLHMAQPPLSQQIKNLEDELGVLLLARTKRKVELTPAGRLFLDEARLTLIQAERAQRIAVEADHGVRGHLRIGFVTSACYSILPGLIRRFRKENPLIDLELMEMTPSRQIAAMEEGSIDAGILRPPVGPSCLRVKTMLEEPMVAALPVDHRKADQKSINLKTLAGDAFILFPRHHGPGIFDVVMKACHEAGFTPSVSYSPNEMQTILAYVAAGMGVSLVPQSLSGFHQHSIVYQSLRGSRVRVELALISRRSEENPILDLFSALGSEVGMEYASQFQKTLTQ
ncbi:Hca operon transcriptional activator HcaR [Pontiella desulfatans]|uniref:Hca operon transcriptional activator HcaR n=1 Tax=Pontiella desulfatans TaxID=2750659 RepID=A0A6C2UD90_PONDE|nr:LysR family transcriptional regulator [Pontiella desulfatans]VGO17344.1 Hca operon transcriptional activator HcaR [Pontiella desulfatans]